MVSDTIYDLCIPILKDSSLEEEDKTDQLEDLLKAETGLTGSSLENAVLDVLWKFRESAEPSSTPPPARHIVLRRPSPAPWQLPRGSTPLASSPGSGVSLAPPAAFVRGKSYTASPFTSPRPSPRLAFSSPRIPHSPNLNAYEFPTETTPGPDISGDYGIDNVDWLVNDDTASVTSSFGGYDGALSNGAPPPGFVQPQQVDMSPYDILRSVLGQARSDDEIERALESNGYDLTTAIKELMGDPSMTVPQTSNVMSEKEATVLVGKSMTPNPSTQGYPMNHQRSGVVCKYYLQSGTCLRADCRFSHDLSNHVCKYWLMGHCLAGDNCVFSHDPSSLVNQLSVEDNGLFSGSPPNSTNQPGFQIQDYNSFPALQQIMANQWAAGYQSSIDALSYAGMYHGGHIITTPPPGFMAPPNFLGENSFKRPRSRPGSRQSRTATPSLPSVDDTEAFPSLGSSTNVKTGKKHHGKRGGHGNHINKELAASTLADIVKMSPSPGPGHQSSRRTTSSTTTTTTRSKRNSDGTNAGRENNAAAQAIPTPEHIPWLETGEKANKPYLKARQEAIKHGNLRNKFLQSAAQAWNRNDARAAKTLSLRGQSENELMRKSHREAARQLSLQQEQQQQQKQQPTTSSLSSSSSSSSRTAEVYIDLHGLHPTNEATQQLHQTLLGYEHAVVASPTATSPAAGDVYVYVYVIIPAVNGKDKIGKVVRNWLNETGYSWREFHFPSSGTPTSSSSSSSSSSSPATTITTAGGGGVLILGVDPRSASASGNSTTTTNTTTSSTTTMMMGEKVNKTNNNNNSHDDGIQDRTTEDDDASAATVDKSHGGADVAITTTIPAPATAAAAVTIPTGDKVLLLPDTSEVPGLGVGRGKVRILKRG
ncbi:MAG: hypothetical protein M1816_006095 [Peltula sp. TS41687]|nr:MAG: hypothetical protein M1816_006095 [Peltula sp. TS41687]